MALLWILGSSRKSRKLPFWDAFHGLLGHCVEKGWWRSKKRLHNMGLCHMDQARDGGGQILKGGGGAEG